MQSPFPSAANWLAAGLLLGAAWWGARAALGRYGNGTPWRNIFLAFLPLLPLAFFWRFGMTYGGVLVTLFIFAVSAGRFFSLLDFPGRREPHFKRAWMILGATVLVYACWGAWWQYRSYSLLGMQWLDWGHYYEALLNTWRGRFFHLNISHGCFLGARFCPSLLILSPVLWAGIPGFFFAGALAVAAGAWAVYGISREYGCGPGEALLWSLWYLLLPGTVNLMLPLLDGFHEVFLLLPASLGALYFYLRKRYWAAWALVIFSFGLRETAAFMFLGFGVTLFLTGRRRHGVFLAAASLAALALIFGVLMPLYRPAGTAYSHVTFYPHLGNTVFEIALSPILRPAAFWGRIFSLHSLWYCAALFIPFAFTAFSAPKWLFPMVCDFVMVLVDERFDSQTLLRHYQCAMLITLTAAALEALRLAREGRAPRWAGWFLTGMPRVRKLFFGMAAGTFAATLGMTLFFTQVPGLPGSDPRLGEWSDAREFVGSFVRLIEPGAEVTAGPRLASFLVGTHETFFDYDDESQLKRYVFIESFVPTYNEHRFRRKLLKSPEWTLLKSEYLDERLVQLFEHVPRKTDLPRPVRLLGDADWRACGDEIPSGMPELSLRGMTDGKSLIVSVRVNSRLRCDVGFSLTLDFHDAPRTVFFDSFGHGIYPADFASPGEVYTFAVPLPGRLKGCKVDLVTIP